MKLLKIILENLASYEGAYTIDFTREPLKSTGLYSIVGPTGSGKSTILDAICLALYGKAPRFEDATDMKFFDNKEQHAKERSKILPPGDPRNILHKGAKEGRAEVEFIANDGERYCAIWYVKHGTKQYAPRERTLLKYVKKADGTETAQTLFKRNADSPLFREIIGLDYEQFTRTIMLAQNSFANFIKCDAKDKAKLLERLTGTEIYTQIAVRIKAHYDEARLQFDKFHSLVKAEEENQMQDEERRECESELRQTQERIKTTENLARNTEQQIDWLHQWNDLKQAYRAIQETLTHKRRELEAHNNDEKQLKIYNALTLHISGQYAKFKQMEEDIEQIRKTIVVMDQNLQQAHSAETRLQQETKDLQKQLETEEKQYEELQPQLIKARNILSVLSVKQTDAGLLENKNKAARTKWEAARQAQSENQKKQELLQLSLNQTETTLSQLKPFEKAIQKADLLIKTFEELKELENILVNDKKQLTVYHSEAQQLSRAEGDLKQKQDQTQLETDKINKSLQTLETQLKKQDAVKLRIKIEQANTNFNCFKEAFDSWSSYFTCIRNCYNYQKEIDEKRQIILQLQLKAEQLTGSKQTIETQLPGIQTAYQMFVSKSAGTMRSLLKEGSPCPVCGAIHHPYAETPAADSAAETLRLKQQELIDKKAETEQQLNIIQTQLSQEKGTVTGLQKRLELEQSDLPEKEKKWSSMIQLDESLRLVISAQDRDGGVRRYRFLEQKRNEAERILTKLQDEEKILLQLDNEYKKLQHLKDSQLKVMSDIDKAYNEARLKSAQKQKETDLLAQQIQKEDGQHMKVIHELNGYGLEENWMSMWQKAPDSYKEKWLKRKDIWEQSTLNKEATASDLKSLQESRNALNAQEEDTRLHLQQTTKEYEKVLEEQHRFEVQLKNFWNGAMPDEVERNAKVRVEKCRQSYEAVLERTNKAKSASESLKATIAMKRQQLQTSVEQKDIQIAAIENWLKTSDYSISFDQLTWYFSPERKWDELREILTHLKEDLKEVEGQVKVRQQQLKEKETDQHHTDLPEEALCSTLQQLQDQLVQEKKVQQTNLFKLENDKQSRLRLKEIQKEGVQIEKAYSNWTELNKLMGANQGDDIRQAAQCYTLQFLIAHANRQLKILTSRYRLVQVPDSLSLRVKDMDYAGEERNVSSLSGGETFLISLALALGLSAISSDNHNYGMLFIDEGFGTLDQESLNTVIDALSTLQSVQGKKVCVISHTQEMRERIPVQIQVIKGNAEGKSSLRII